MSWNLSPHICRRCLGRILEREGEYRCSGCGLSCGREPWDICGCGLRAKTPIAKRSGFRCVPNPTPSPASPAEIVILFDAAAPVAVVS